MASVKEATTPLNEAPSVAVRLAPLAVRPASATVAVPPAVAPAPPASAMVTLTVKEPSSA